MHDKNSLGGVSLVIRPIHGDRSSAKFEVEATPSASQINLLVPVKMNELILGRSDRSNETSCCY